MRLLPRREPKPPHDLRERLGIPSRERILAWGAGPGADGESGTTVYLAATDTGLYVEATNARYGWDLISRASWEEPVLDVVILAEDGDVKGSLRLLITQSGDLPAAIHDRVVASVVVSEVLDIGNDERARMVARRATDDSAIRWSVVFDPGLDPSDPDRRARASAALDSLRSTLGI